MTHLGVYYAPEHRIPGDTDYIAKLQPPVIRLLDPDVQQIADMHALVSWAVIATRTWAIDDNNGAAVKGIMADPVATGADHANQYRGQLDRWHKEAAERGLTLPDDAHIYFNAANEPNQGGTPDKIAAYTVAFLNRCTELGIHATALCLGVGWPDNTGPDTPVNWEPYATIVEPIKRGQHWLELHEYHYKDGPQNNWTWWAGRHLQCPFDVPILLGEIGIDNYVDKPRWDKEGGNRGWQGNVTPDQYGEMIEWHIRHSDTRVVAALPFVTDFRNREWESFNTRGAHQAFLARKDNMIPQATPNTTPTTPPHTVHLPAIGNNPPKTAYVTPAIGVNIRADSSATSEKLGAVAYGEPVSVLGTTVDTAWSNITHDGVTGWMLSSLLSSTPPATTPTQPPAPTGDDWPRIYAFVKRWEGEWADNPADPGGATNKGVTLATYKRWREIQGQSEPTKDDLRNLSDAETERIFHDLYYVASGSDKLSWPLSLANTDTAINAGVGRAQETLAQSGGNFLSYAGHLIQWYASIRDPDWTNFSRGWMRRRADLLIEAAKP